MTPKNENLMRTDEDRRSGIDRRLAPERSDQVATGPAHFDELEFVEISTDQPVALGEVLVQFGFGLVGRHRWRDKLLYRQGRINIVVRVVQTAPQSDSSRLEGTFVSGIGLKVRDARAIYHNVLTNGSWRMPDRAEVMELHIPSIMGPGACRIFFVESDSKFSIYDVDYKPIDDAQQNPPALVSNQVFGLAIQVRPDQASQWQDFFSKLLDAQEAPANFNPSCSEKILALQSKDKQSTLMLKLTTSHQKDAGEGVKCICLAVSDLHQTMNLLVERGVEFAGAEAVLTDQGRHYIAKTKPYLGSFCFDLIHSPGAH